MEEELTKLSIREWSKDDRPRERMLAQGVKALTDAELIAVLLRSGSRDDSAVDLAKLILHRAGNDLNRLAAMGPQDLMRIKGVGEAKAVSIAAALELGQRRRNATLAERPLVAMSQQAYDVLRPLLADLPHEEFWLLLLDRGNRLVDRACVSRGGLHGTVADPKVIFREALDRRASSLVLAHNHPSGQLRPSAEDIQLTRKLVEAGRVLDITVQDHLIIGLGGYYSFADNGQL